MGKFLKTGEDERGFKCIMVIDLQVCEKKWSEHGIYKNESDKNMVCVKTSLTGISLFS